MRAGLRILHVDDDRVNRLVLDDLLRLLGHVPEPTESAAQALAVLAERDFDLVMTDIHMPGMTGHELLAELRRTRPALPVIAVTADLMSHDEVGYLALGFAASPQP